MMFSDATDAYYHADSNKAKNAPLSEIRALQLLGPSKRLGTLTEKPYTQWHVYSQFIKVTVFRKQTTKTRGEKLISKIKSKQSIIHRYLSWSNVWTHKCKSQQMSNRLSTFPLVAPFIPLGMMTSVHLQMAVDDAKGPWKWTLTQTHTQTQKKGRA